MTDQEEEDIQENFNMSYEQNTASEKFIYIFVLIIICFLAGFISYYIYLIIGFSIMGSDGPSGKKYAQYFPTDWDCI